MFGSNYGKLFENQTRLIGQAKTNPQTVTWLEKLTAYTKSSKKRLLQEKFSRTRHNRTLHFAYAMTNLKIYLSSRARSLSRAIRGQLLSSYGGSKGFFWLP